MGRDDLGFYRGASLPDPAGLLGGTGKATRHLQPRSANAVDRPQIAELLRTAKAERVEALKQG